MLGAARRGDAHRGASVHVCSSNSLTSSTTFRTSLRLCEQALEEAGGEPSSQLVDSHTAGDATRLASGSTNGRQSTPGPLRDSPSETGDPMRHALALADLCFKLTMRGLPYDEADMARALELEEQSEGLSPAAQRPSVQLGIILGLHGLARTQLARCSRPRSRDSRAPATTPCSDRCHVPIRRHRAAGGKLGEAAARFARRSLALALERRRHPGAVDRAHDPRACTGTSRQPR